MPKFIISWDAGYGSKDATVVDANDLEDANMKAYEEWRRCAEDNADYDAQPYTKELAKELEIEDDQ